MDYPENVHVVFSPINSSFFFLFSFFNLLCVWILFLESKQSFSFQMPEYKPGYYVLELVVVVDFSSHARI